MLGAKKMHAHVFECNLGLLRGFPKLSKCPPEP